MFKLRYNEYSFYFNQNPKWHDKFISFQKKQLSP